MAGTMLNSIFLLVLVAQAHGARTEGLLARKPRSHVGLQAIRHRNRINGRHLSHSQRPIDAVRYCDSQGFTSLFTKIPEELKYWRKKGISADLMKWTLTDIYDFPVRLKGAGVLFEGGKPYIVTDPMALEINGHHKRLVAAHFALFLAMSQTFGKAIPDVEFLVNTGDEPASLLAHFGNGTDPEHLPPVLSFCKSESSHADILVPDIHFFMRNFTTNFLQTAQNFTQTWPWERRRELLFGRFSPYSRMVNGHAPELRRVGTKGKDICNTSPTSSFCEVRRHYIWEFATAANSSGLPLDVAQQPKRDMLYHASHKWLLHLDGQTCSSRLEQLLVLGSLVFKEESGYRAFFHHLIQPYKHYIPIWKTYPEDTADAINWAREHDSEAAAMGMNAQRFALRYLHKRALMCYWFKLLKAYADLLTYKPGGSSRDYPFMVPVEDWMRDEGWNELKEHHIEHMEFWD